MRISLKHSSGSSLEVSGWGARRYAREWLAAQEPSEEEEGRPKVVGTSSYFSGAVDRDYEHGANSRFHDMPVVFGFVPNEVNRVV